MIVFGLPIHKRAFGWTKTPAWKQLGVVVGDRVWGQVRDKVWFIVHGPVQRSIEYHIWDRVFQAVKERK